jgi:hypothetical protein
MMNWLILIYTTFGYPAAPKYYVTPISNVYKYVFSYEYVVKLVEYIQVFSAFIKSLLLFMAELVKVSLL